MVENFLISSENILSELVPGQSVHLVNLEDTEEDEGYLREDLDTEPPCQARLTPVRCSGANPGVS